MRRRIRSGRELWRDDASAEDRGQGRADRTAWSEVGGPGLRVGVDLVHVGDMTDLYPDADEVWLTREEWEEVTGPLESSRDAWRRRAEHSGAKTGRPAVVHSVAPSETRAAPGLAAKEGESYAEQSLGLASVHSPSELRLSAPPGLLERLAGRFAAKEAVMKVLSCGLDRIELTDIEVRRFHGGRPQVRLRGSALAAWSLCGLERLELSISHHRDYALAVAVGSGRAEAAGDPVRSIPVKRRRRETEQEHDKE